MLSSGFMPRLAVLLGSLATLALAGCGGGQKRSATTPAPASPVATDRPTATAPEAPPPPSDSAGPKPRLPGGAPGAPPPRGSGGETATGPSTGPSAGPKSPAPGGGSEVVRVPARFRVRGARLHPSVIEVPRFLAVAVTVASQDGRAHEVTVGTTPPRRLRVPPGGQASVRLPGLREGRYPITVDGRRRGALVAGAEAVGP